MPGKKVLRREFFLCDSFIISDWLAAHYDNFFDFTYSWLLLQKVSICMLSRKGSFSESLFRALKLVSQLSD